MPSHDIPELDGWMDEPPTTPCSISSVSLSANQPSRSPLVTALNHQVSLSVAELLLPAFPSQNTPHPSSSSPYLLLPLTTTLTTPSQKRNHLLPLKRIPLLQRRPPGHAARFDAEHLLVAVLGLEIAHALGFLDPRVPHHHVRQVVAGHAELGALGVRDDDLG